MGADDIREPTVEATVIYVLAAIGLATVVVVVWRAFGPAVESQRSARTQVPPDDDPEFLRRLDEQRRNKPNDGTGDHSDGTGN